jgi:tetratricopeptide (TPR) repeat protein
MAGVSRQCRMNILLNSGKSKELIEEFKAEDIESWPAAESVIARGFYCRGRAYAQLKNGAAAEADLKKAAGHHVDDNIVAGGILFALGNNYRDNLKDNASALATYKIIIDNMRSFYAYNFVLLPAAVILREQGKYDDALKLLGSADLSRSPPHPRVAFLGEWGETLAACGRKAEAITKFNEALAIKEIPEDRKELYTKRIAELGGSGK